MGEQPPENTEVTVQQQKRVYFIIVGALICSVFMYGLLVYFMSQSQRPRPLPSPTLSLGCAVIAVISLFLSAGWLYMRTRGKIGDTAPQFSLSTTPSTLMTPEQFQTETVVALALAEVCCIFGLLLFFSGSPPATFAIYAIGTLLVDLLYILPRGIIYWRAWEDYQNRLNNTGQNPFNN